MLFSLVSFYVSYVCCVFSIFIQHLNFYMSYDFHFFHICYLRFFLFIFLYFYFLFFFFSSSSPLPLRRPLLFSSSLFPPILLLLLLIRLFFRSRPQPPLCRPLSLSLSFSLFLSALPRSTLVLYGFYPASPAFPFHSIPFHSIPFLLLLSNSL